MQDELESQKSVLSAGPPSTESMSLMVTDGKIDQGSGGQVAVSNAIKAEAIRLFYADHWTMHAIAKHLNIHHDTVKSILNSPAFARPRVERSSQLDKYHDLIVETVEKYPKIRSTRIMAMLKDRGYNGGIGILRNKVRTIRLSSCKAYLPTFSPAGEKAQVDWAHCTTTKIGDCIRPVYLFLMVLCWSRAIFAKFTHSMEQAVFQRCHDDAFSYYGGVPRILIYDNLKSVVISRDGKDIRFNDSHHEFSSWYRFRSLPCNPYSGWEKGRVERAVRYARENFLTGRQFKNIAEANKEIRIWMENTTNNRLWPEDKKFTVGDKLAEEKKLLMSLPNQSPPMAEVRITRSGKVPWVRFDKNDYSIPFTKVRQPVTIRALEDIVRIFHGDLLIAEHKRCWAKDKKIRNPEHFSRLIEERQVAGAATLQQAFLSQFPNAEGFLSKMVELRLPIATNCRKILALLEHHAHADVAKAVALAQEKDMPRAQIVTQILVQQQMDRNRPASLPLALPDHPGVKNLISRNHSLADYDQLTEEEGNDYDN